MRTTLYKILEIPVVYDFVQNVLTGERVFSTLEQAFHAKFKDCAHQKILDVGCGTGILAEWVKGEYYGLDMNLQYLKKAQKLKSGCFLFGDATQLPFPAEAFDLVCTLGVLHHLDYGQCQIMLSEMARVCKMNGHLVVLDGLIPSNKFNLIGYALAKLDRGKYKMKLTHFQSMLSGSFPQKTVISFESYPIFPGEYVLSVITKSENDLH